MHFIKQLILFTLKEGKKIHIINLSAQMSYRALLAFIPFLMLFYNFINWISGEMNETILTTLYEVIPKGMIDYMNLAMENAINTPISLSSNLIFLFFILYVSISAMHSLIVSLNQIFEQEETRGIFALWFQSVIYLFLFLIIAFLTIFFYIFGEKFLEFIFSYFHIFQGISVFLTFFSTIYMIIIVTLIFTLIYKFAPKNHLSFSDALPGGFFVTIGWLSTLFIYQIFINATMSFSEFFNDLQGPFSLCILIFLICFIITLGGVINLYFIKHALNKERRF